MNNRPPSLHAEIRSRRPSRTPAPMLTLLALAGVLAGALPGATAHGGEAEEIDYRRVIDNCFDDSEPNSSFSCYFSAGKLRMRWSARDCVIEAAKVGARGNRTSARQWLKACACGNSAAQNAIEKAGNDAVDYAVQYYADYEH